MTAPIWMASPPEVHSALLSSGPGPGSLLAAAGAWSSLSAEYAAVADELTALLAAVQAGAWQGPSSESYAAANLPYLAWLMQASADSTAAATQHETAAAAYTAALAAMPTLAELAANHATHAVLVATNFFGINTIPIVLNEADYVRMWIQAATTMATYQTVSSTAVASTPDTDPAPQILNTAGSTSAQAQGGQSGSPQNLVSLLQSLIDKLGLQNLEDEFGIDNIFHFLENPVGYTETHLFNHLSTNPVEVLANPLYLFFDGDEIFFPLGYLIPLTYPALAIAPVGGLGGLGGLAGLAEPAVAPALAPVAAPPDVFPAPTMAPTVAVPAAAPAPAPATPAVASTAPPPAPPAAGGMGFFPPYLVAPPGIGFDSGTGTGPGATPTRKMLQPDTAAAAAAAAAARGQARARRRRRATLRGYGDEFMDMNVEVDPDWGAAEPVASTAASDRAAGPLGFAGTVRTDARTAAAGLTTLAGDEFGGGPAVPMVPGTWDADQSDESREGRDRG